MSEECPPAIVHQAGAAVAADLGGRVVGIVQADSTMNRILLAASIVTVPLAPEPSPTRKT